MFLLTFFIKELNILYILRLFIIQKKFSIKCLLVRFFFVQLIISIQIELKPIYIFLMNIFTKNRYIFDGGMGQTLIDKGMISKGTLWSATALVDESLNHLVLDSHLDFINSGAEVIVTSNFKVRKNTFIENAIIDRFDFANRMAGELAFNAKIKSNKNILIAGSLPTRGITYQPHFDYDENLIFDEFHQVANELNPFVDFFYLDVLSSIKEITTALNSIKDFNKPSLLGLYFRKNFLLPSGETIEDVVNAIKKFNVVGLMASCVSPEIYQGIQLSLKKQNLPFGFAVNAFIDIPDKIPLDENFSAQPNKYLGLRKEITPKVFTQFAIDSLNNGAKFLKGCCNILPKHIEFLNKTL